MTNAESLISRSLGTRSYSANAYYNIDKAPQNLRIFTSSQAKKIVLDQQPPPLNACGVVMQSGNHSVVIQADREIILSSGVYQTPQLLELSGIGNRSLLKTHGIPLLYENPALGENYQDHMTNFFAWILKPRAFQTWDQLRYHSTFEAETVGHVRESAPRSASKLLLCFGFSTLREDCKWKSSSCSQVTCA